MGRNIFERLAARFTHASAPETAQAPVTADPGTADPDAGIPAHDVRPYFLNVNAADAARAASNDMEKIFYTHAGRRSVKWHHYLEVYDRFLSRFRDTPVRILEIGVQDGGSLQIWRKYLGRKAVIFGIDIDARCRAFDDAEACVRIGSQNDPDFLREVVREMGGVDIVVDDGSHVAEHQATSFRTLFPLLETGGVYLCEDVQTSYWRVYHNGGYQRPGTFIELTKQMLDDMHAWYHDEPQKLLPDIASTVFGVSVFDGIVVIEKRQRQRGHFSAMPPDPVTP